MIENDRRTIMQIFGCLMTKPSILNDVDKYQLKVEDFSETLDRYIFSAIYNLYQNEAEQIHVIDIETYLSRTESAKRLFNKSNGIDFLQDCETFCELENFNYYYNRFKKINLLRDLQKSGKSIDKFYSEDLLDSNSDSINQKFETLSLEDIINELKSELSILEDKYVTGSNVQESYAFDGVEDLIEELKLKPEVGLPLQGDIFNTVTRGGRKGKLYLRSACSGGGKSRNMVADACYMAYPIRYEEAYGKWIATGSCEKVLYVMTEQDPAEIQTMILSYLTGINEDVFVYGKFNNNEDLEKIAIAIQIMKKYRENFIFAHMPDPCSSIVQNLFRKYNLQKQVTNFYYDYIFSSPAMLNEYRDLGIREDVCLRLFTTTLKNLAVELNSFIMTGTQITEDKDTKGFRDFHQIRGAKAISDLVDVGCIMSRPTQEEIHCAEAIPKIWQLEPNIITDIYKNRRGKWTHCRIWSYVNLGTCRRYDLFLTDANNKPCNDFNVINFDREVSNDVKELEDHFNNGKTHIEESKSIMDEFIAKERRKNDAPEYLELLKTAFDDRAVFLEKTKKQSIGEIFDG